MASKKKCDTVKGSSVHNYFPFYLKFHTTYWVCRQYIDYAFEQAVGNKILLGKWIKRYRGNCRYAGQIDPKLISVMPKIRP